MERFPGLAAAALAGRVIAQPHAHQLAQCVVEVRRIEGAPGSLLSGRALILQAGVHEDSLRLVRRHAFGAQADRPELADVALPCIGQLADVDFWAAVAQPGIPRHLTAQAPMRQGSEVSWEPQ